MSYPKDIILIIASLLPWRHRAKLARVSKGIWGAMKGMMKELKRIHYTQVINMKFNWWKFGQIPRGSKYRFAKVDPDRGMPGGIDILYRVVMFFDGTVPEDITISVANLTIQFGNLQKVTTFVGPAKLLWMDIGTPIHVGASMWAKHFNYNSPIPPKTVYVCGFTVPKDTPQIRFQILKLADWVILDYKVINHIQMLYKQYNETKIALHKLKRIAYLQ
jgi:hypothetical protein